MYDLLNVFQILKHFLIANQLISVLLLLLLLLMLIFLSLLSV